MGVFVHEFVYVQLCMVKHGLTGKRSHDQLLSVTDHIVEPDCIQWIISDTIAEMNVNHSLETTRIGVAIYFSIKDFGVIVVFYTIKMIIFVDYCSH